VAEGVVVGLEAIEVEDDEHRRPGVVPFDRGLEVGEEAAAVAQAGQGVRQRFLPAAGEEPQVLVDGDRHAGDHDEHARGGEQERRCVNGNEMVRDEHCERERREGSGERERGKSFLPRAFAPRSAATRRRPSA
jgi:hypothetical protein